MGLFVRSAGVWVGTSGVTSGTRPGAPTGLIASSSTSGQVAASWTAGLAGSAPTTGYVVTLTSSAATTKTVTTATTNATITGLVTGAMYSVSVQAVNAVGTSAPSSSVNVTVAGSAPSGTGFLLNPSAHGYPDTTNTGYLNYFDPTLGRKLKLSDLTAVGSMSSTSNNQIIERLHINGQLKIQHNGVIVRGCLIEKTNGDGKNGVEYGITDHNFGLTAAWTMTYCTLIGHPTAGEVTMLNTEWCNHSYLDISGGTDGWNPWGPHNTEFHHCYVHDLVPFNGSHSDCLQIVSGSTHIYHNTLISCNPSYPIGAFAGGDTSVFPGNTSGMQIGKLTGTLRDVVFEDNLCDGGNYMFNGNWSADTPDANGVTHIQDPTTSVTIRDNRFGRDRRFGISTHIPDGHNFVISNNIFDDDGSAAWG
jgi:hypothetical protein